MSTITRGATVLQSVILGWSTTRATRTVVHDLLLTADVEVTARPAGPRTGTLRTGWATHAQAESAATDLATPGTPWVIDATDGQAGMVLTVAITGDVTVAADGDDGDRWAATAGFTEVTA